MSEASAVARAPRSDVASVSDDLVVADMIKDVAMMDGEVQRWAVKVPLKPVHQYSIRSGIPLGNNRWKNVYRVFVTAEGYDWMNRIMGVQLHVPEWVHDETGAAVRNPIHRRDYIYLRMVGIGYNDLGQMVAHAEDVEIDYMVEWQKERLKQKSATVVIDEATGMPKMTEQGQPIVTLSQEHELKAYQRLYQLRSFGPRQAQTVARTRILKLFSGIRTLYEVEGEEPTLNPVGVSLVGYRDRMTPDERLKRAQEQAKEVFGSEIKVGEDEVRVEEEEQAVIEAELVESEGEVQATAQTPVVAMPGERISAKALCGAVNEELGVCTQPQDHAPVPHKSEDGVWPVE